MLKNICVIMVLILLFGCSKTENVPEVVELKTWQDSVSYSLGYDVGKSFSDRKLEYNEDLFNLGFLNTYNEDTSYAYGASLASSLKLQGIEITSDVLLNSFENTINGDSLLLSESEVSDIIRRFNIQLRQEKEEEIRKMVEKNDEDGAKFIEEYKKEHLTAHETDSGLIYRIIKEGYGDIPAQTDKVIVHYIGKLIDGSVFDSSLDRDDPTTMPVNGVIKGWQEALTAMPVGSKWELVIPSKLGYGDRNSGRVPGGSTLIFEIELLGIE